MTLVVGTNSYVDVSDTDAYFADAIHSGSWDSADADTQSRALVTATRMLDRQLWKGTKTSSSQALEWPRTGVVDRYGDAIDENTVPAVIIQATQELALSLIDDPDVQTNASTSSGIKRAKAGSAEVEYFKPTPRYRFPTIVQELVKALMGGSIISGAAYGIDKEAYSNDPDLSGGLY